MTLLTESGDNLFKECMVGVVVMVVSYREMACLPRPAMADEVRVADSHIRSATKD